MIFHKTGRSAIGLNAITTAILSILAQVLACVSPGRAALIPIYGGPTYTPAAGGIQSQFDGISQPLNNSGVAIGSGEKFTASGTDKGRSAFRWDGSGAAPLEFTSLSSTPSGFTNNTAQGINDAGITVGEAEKYDGSGNDKGYRAVRWSTAGAVTELGNIGTAANGLTFDLARAVNAGGTTVGYGEKYVSGSDKGSRAVRWDASTTIATELGNLGTSTAGVTSGIALAINSLGTALGEVTKYDGSGNPKGGRAVRWAAGSTTATELGVLGTDTSGNTVAQPFAINDAGTAVGTVEKHNGTDAELGTRAVRWLGSGTAATELGNLGTDASGDTFADALAINSIGTTVGDAEKYDASHNDKGRRAVRWDASGTAAIELGNLGASLTGLSFLEALVINDNGLIVGTGQKYDGAGNYLHDSAILWALDGSAKDLNDLIDPNSGWVLTSAQAISNTNWIVGVGTYDPDGAGGQSPYDRVFLLDASSLIPEPNSAGILLIISSLSLRRIRRVT